MTLKVEEMQIIGRTIKVTQLSWIKRLGLWRDNTSENLIKLSLSKEDFEFLDNIPPNETTGTDLTKLLDLIFQLNVDLFKKEDKVKDFPEKVEDSKT